MKVKLLQVTGIAGNHHINLIRLVSVVNDEDLIATLRINFLKEALRVPLMEAHQAEALKSLKVGLYDTGLREYPEDPQTVAALYRKLTTPAQAEEETLVNV